MKIAVISDIHSNIEALEAVLDEIQRLKAAEIVCLGDIVGYGPDPGLVLDRLQGLSNLNWLLGNHDTALINRQERQKLNPDAQIVLNWTDLQLNSHQKEWLKGGKELTLWKEQQTVWFHSSPLQLNEYLMNQFQIRDFLTEMDRQYGLGYLYVGGHTHLRTIASFRGAKILTHDFNGVCKRKLEENLSYYINPGSVGQPRGGMGTEASFALIDLKNRVVESRIVAYDFRKTQQKMRDLGLPEFFAERLEKGI